MRRAAVTAIERSLGELQQRLPLTWDRLELLREVLAVQAEESLASAEAAYAAGAAGALDLLDAERTLLQVRIAAARAEADYAIALAQLEGAIATPLSALAAPSMAGAAVSPRGERP
jgi:outer membrane protein TolC